MVSRERLVGIIVASILLIGAIAIYKSWDTRNCLRSHVEVNNVPAHTEMYCANTGMPYYGQPYGIGANQCLLSSRVVPAQRLEWTLCDEYEKK